MRIFIPYIRLPNPTFFTAPGVAVALIICAFTTTVNAEEDYYTWIDENGVTNYAERNPQGYQAEYVTKTRRFGQRVEQTQTEAPKVPDSPSSAPAANTDDIISEEKAVLRAEIAATKKSNCDIGKKNLARLQMFSRVRVTDEKGENRTLSAEEKSAKEAQARKIVNENCKG
ncbi:MAG: hypothetical protein ACI9VI_003349 [Candidatus Azotimanducaceae bacterium]|jgi:hypothetical protein